jgi:hypothetical protein
MKVKANQLLGLLKVSDHQALTAKDQQIGQLFTSLWPLRADDLAKFRANTECSCKSTLAQAFTEDPVRTKQFFDGAAAINLANNTPIDISQYADLEQEDVFGAPGRPRTIPRSGNTVLFTGRTVDIDDTPEAWERHCRQMVKQQAVFQHMAVREIGPGRIRIYYH